MLRVRGCSVRIWELGIGTDHSRRSARLMCQTSSSPSRCPASTPRQHQNRPPPLDHRRKIRANKGPPFPLLDPLATTMFKPSRSTATDNLFLYICTVLTLASGCSPPCVCALQHVPPCDYGLVSVGLCPNAHCHHLFSLSSTSANSIREPHAGEGPPSTCRIDDPSRAPQPHCFCLLPSFFLLVIVLPFLGWLL